MKEFSGNRVPFDGKKMEYYHQTAIQAVSALMREIHNVV